MNGLLAAAVLWTPTAQAQTRSPEIVSRDGAPRVLVPAGEFIMGHEQWDADEQPVHQVYLDAFSMDTYEVTTARYAKFMQETGREQPAQGRDVNPATDGHRPVVGITWTDADAYCHHYGKRLPTEAEWEKAARGTDGRMFPSGNEEPTCLHANFGSAWIGYETLLPGGVWKRARVLTGSTNWRAMRGSGWRTGMTCCMICDPRTGTTSGRRAGTLTPAFGVSRTSRSNASFEKFVTTQRNRANRVT